MVILELIHAKNLDFEGVYLLDKKTNALRGSLVIHNNLGIAWPCAGDGSFKFRPYQLSMVRYWLTMGSMGYDE